LMSDENGAQNVERVPEFAVTLFATFHIRSQMKIDVTLVPSCFDWTGRPGCTDVEDWSSDLESTLTPLAH
jgi:hypothetical protein